LEPVGGIKVAPSMWYLGGSAQGPIPPPIAISNIRAYSSSGNDKEIFAKQKKYFETQGITLPDGWIFGGYDGNGNIIPISKDDFSKLSADNQSVLLNEGVVGLNRKMAVDSVNWNVVMSNVLASHNGNPYDWAYQMGERGELPWETIRSLLGIGYSVDVVEGIMRGVRKDDEMTDAEYFRTVYVPLRSYPQQKYALKPMETPARDIALDYVKKHPNDMRVKYDLSTYQAAVPIEAKDKGLAWAQRFESAAPIEVGIGIHESLTKLKEAQGMVNQWNQSINESMGVPKGTSLQAVTFYKMPKERDLRLWVTGTNDEFKVSGDTEWADKALQGIMTDWYLPVVGDPSKFEKGVMAKYKGVSSANPDYAKIVATKYLVDDPLIRGAYTLNTAWEAFKALGFGIPITVIKAAQQDLSGKDWEAVETRFN
jgi:hypothetical protein